MTSNPYFSFDSIFSITADNHLYGFLSAISEENSEEKILSVTYNHRGYNLLEKNYIKALIDKFNLEHLMFSLRPSVFKLVSSKPQLDFQKFKALSQIIFVFQAMTRYDIGKAYISNAYLDLWGIESCEAEIVYEKVVTWLDEISDLLYKAGASNVKNLLCSLHSFKSKRNKLKGKTLYFQETLLDKMKYNGADVDLDLYQISPLEKDIFWIGFDSAFKEVPWDKPYETTKWNKSVLSSKYGVPLYGDKIHYCNRCCMPETMEGITFDELGICNICASSEEKMHINWEEREANLGRLLNQHHQEDYYDCMLPMSGGKDSSFQAYVLTHRYKVNALAVTHGANWMSLSGRYNLENCLQKFDLDHIIFHPARTIINKAARKSLKVIGDACWHCHIGAGTFPIQTSVKWDLKLMIWGESIAEFDGRGTYYTQVEASPFYNLEVSARVPAEEYADSTMTTKELNQWYYPTKEELLQSEMRYLHLGDFIFWDEEKHVDFLVRNFEWMDSQVENTYKGYKSTECVMAGVHDYLNFLKRGIGRATWHASDDIRRGLITREEGIELAKKYDSQRPHALDYYLKLTGYTEEELEDEILKARNLSSFANKLNDK